MLFTDPTYRIKSGYHEARTPLPVNLNLLRAAFNSEDPARAGLVALVEFHGLRAGQLTRLHLTDLRDGRLHLDGRVIILAKPVRQRLSAYLDLRQQRWPTTANPHLFVTWHTARRTEPCSRRWIWLTIGPELSVASVAISPPPSSRKTSSCRPGAVLHAAREPKHTVTLIDFLQHSGSHRTPLQNSRIRELSDGIDRADVTRGHRRRCGPEQPTSPEIACRWKGLDRT